MGEVPGPGGAVQRIAANIGLAVVSAAIFLAAAEGAVRLWDALRGNAPGVQSDPVETLYARHPYLPIALRPGSDYRDNDTSGRINALGLRGPERTAARPPGAFRVICVGGSTTFGAGIAGDEKTYPARLEARLREANPGLEIEVWNAGVPGYTTAENVIYLGLRLIDFEPDIVVLYEGYNDFKPNRHPGFVSDYSHWRDRAVTPRRPPLEWLRLVAKGRALAARWFTDPNSEVRDPASGQTLRRYDTVGEEGLAAFRRNLRTMVRTASGAGARAVLATYPHPCTEENLRARPELFTYLPGYLPTLTFAGVRDAFDRYNEAVRAVAAEEGAILADAARAIPPDADFFVDHVHFNARGADLFAEVVAGAILPAIRPAPDADPSAAARGGGAGAAP